MPLRRLRGLQSLIWEEQARELQLLRDENERLKKLYRKIVKAYRQEFITAHPVNRAVFKNTAYQMTAPLQIIITGIMPAGIIDELQIIYIKHSYGKFRF